MYKSSSSKSVPSNRYSADSSTTVLGSRQSNSVIGICMPSNPEDRHSPTLRINAQPEYSWHHRAKALLILFSLSLVTVFPE
ncbi:hypothetical protein TNCV_402111 [Trichonephila clavipes]|nr:hypothetical protein TNCV_402111 [Trichonephila clavipes]